MDAVAVGAAAVDAAAVGAAAAGAVAVVAAVVAARVVLAIGTAAHGATPSLLGAARSLDGAGERTSSVNLPSPPGAKVLGTWGGSKAVIGSHRPREGAKAPPRPLLGIQAARSPLGARGSA